MKKFEAWIQEAMFIIVMFILAGVLWRCSDRCQIKTTYISYQPIYSTTEEIKAETGLKTSEPLSTPGKIYLKDNNLFVNETGKGIHLFDNSDPSSPKPIGFLNIPGNYDLAILGNTLYADSYVDLVLFDVSNLSNIKEVGRMEGFFKNYNTMGFYMDPVKGIVTSWAKTGTVTLSENDCSPSQLQSWGGIFYGTGVAVPMNASTALSPQTAVVADPSTGISGSMSRFTIANNFLYAIDGSILAVVDINSPLQPVRETDQSLLSWPETLFPNGQNLFVGSRAGMSIYDITSPGQPVLLSQYEHIYSCDPVVVKGNYAYVTLYNGDICHMNTNELQLIDITDLKNPSLYKIYQMTNPHGLGIDQNLLFICDGSDGLKIFDASNPDSISSRQLAHYPDINALDIIPTANVAMVIGTDGLYQYDYSQLTNIRLLSKIQIVKP
jgi:hypothetical protein